MLYIRTDSSLGKNNIDLLYDKLVTEHEFYNMIQKVIYVQVHTSERRRQFLNNWVSIYDYFNVQRHDIDIETLLDIFKKVPELMSKPICSHCEFPDDHYILDHSYIKNFGKVCNFINIYYETEHYICITLLANNFQGLMPFIEPKIIQYYAGNVIINKLIEKHCFSIKDTKQLGYKIEKVSKLFFTIKIDDKLVDRPYLLLKEDDNIITDGNLLFHYIINDHTVAGYFKPSIGLYFSLEGKYYYCSNLISPNRNNNIEYVVEPLVSNTTGNTNMLQYSLLQNVLYTSVFTDI